MVTIMMGSILMFGTAAVALTLNEAKANIDKRATEKNLDAKDHSQATATLQGLVDKGVPVERASRVVEASINQGTKGRDLAEVAKSIEATGPAARKDAASLAADALQHKYSARETVQMTNTFNKTVGAGAPADRTSQVMSNGINKGLEAGRITAAMDAYAGEVRSGTAPDKAAENATRTMDRDQARDRDADRQMSRDRMGSGSGMDHGGMDHGMDRGSGMGSGAGSAMGGPRR